MQDSAGINNAAKSVSPPPLGKPEQIIPSVTFIFKGQPLIKNVP